MNKQIIVNQLKHLKVYLQRTIIKSFNGKLTVTKHSYHRIRIPTSNEIKVIEREHGTTRHSLWKSNLQKVMLIIVDDGLSLELRHYSPLLQATYINSHVKRETRQRTAARHLVGVQQRCSCSVPSSPNCNAYLRHGTNKMAVQHNCIRFYTTSKQMTVTLLGEINSSKPREFSVNVPSNYIQNKFNNISKTQFKNISEGNIHNKLAKFEIRANNILSIKATNQLLGDHNFWKTFVRRLHNSSKVRKNVEVNKQKTEKGIESSLSNAPPCEPKKTKDLLKECPCCPGQMGIPNNTELSEDARKLLNDLNISNQQQDVIGETCGNKRRYKKPSGLTKINVAAIKDRMKQCKGIRGRSSLNSISNQSSYDVITSYNQEKSKPFATDSRLWNNYVQSNENAHLRLVSEKWLPTSSSVHNDISDNDYILVTTKTKQSFFRDLANSLIKLFRGEDNQLNEQYNSKLMNNAWYNKEPEAKSRYDFTIKHDYKTNEILDTIKRKDNLKIVAEDINKKNSNEITDVNNNFMTQFKRRTENIKLYNSILNLKNDTSCNPEVLKRFYCVIKSVVQDMDNIVVKEDRTITQEEKNTEVDSNNYYESSPTNDVEKSMKVPETLEELNQCKLFSVEKPNLEDQIDTTSFKDTCLHVKIKPLSNTSKFSDIQIEGMKVEVLNMEVNDECSSSSDNLNAGKHKPDKCLLLNMTLKLPFSSKDFLK